MPITGLENEYRYYDYNTDYSNDHSDAPINKRPVRKSGNADNLPPKKHGDL